MNVYEEVTAFYQSYRGQKCIYGTSVLGRPLYALHIGDPSGPQLISQYAIHGREWISGLVALTHVRRGLAKNGAWILPLTNPDGALLAELGPQTLPEMYRKRLLSLNGGGDFSLWKANAEAVDLNVNFDARWGTGASNVARPAPQNYIGPRPCSEPETQALCAFTLRVRPCCTLSWHTKGEVIYWEFHQPPLRRRRDQRLGRALSACTGYPLATVRHSAGGYKDWCIEKLKLPAFTLEIGSDAWPHPVGREALPVLEERLGDALLRFSCDL